MRSLPAHFVDLLLAGARLRSFRRGEALFHMADPSPDMLGIVDGVVDVVLEPGVDGPRLGFVAKAGNWLGAVGMPGMTPRRISAIARRDASVLSVSAHHIETVAMSDPDTWRHIAANIVSHLDNFGQLLHANVHRDNSVRILITLRRLHDFNDGATEFPLTQADLAEMAGLSRNSANRVMRRLAEEGLIETGYGWVRIVDQPRIMSILNRSHLSSWTGYERLEA
ncbi:hypothetical protein BYZ73_03940 [Rhodovulum viride]|uniref:CRP-like cAMP-binding protein n=1 Tax=Rhodovulum viride TaxID=1231134 RepID=A0ABX9DMM5_9RHOB|nr:hypothetical protein BYZ73_03940 [Rhodovulum viride]